MASSLKPSDAQTHPPGSKPGLSTFEKNLDKFDDAAVAAGAIYSKAAGAYSMISEHKDAIAAASKAILDAETLDAVTRTARDILGPAKKVMEGLNALGAIHPFVGVAVVAFNALVTLELKRRENDKRVCGLLLKQADMMVALLQLADVKDPQVVDDKGSSVESRLEGVLRKVKTTIESCGNAIDSYYKQKFIVKFFKSHSFESKFLGFASSFEDRKSEIQFALQINVAVTVHSVDAKIDKLLAVIFQQQTTRERNLAIEVESRGGKEKCLGDPAVLNELIQMTEPTSTNVGGHSKTGDATRQSQAPKNKAPNPSVLFALHAELDVILDENKALFELTMAAQTEQLAAIKSSETRVIAAFQAGPYSRIKDPDIRAVWKEMNWRSSVKARHFVFALHDYYIDKLTNPSVLKRGNEAEQTSAIHSAPHTPALSQAGTELDAEDVANRLRDIERDAWCLPYLSIAFIPAILEAVDDDSSSFIKIKEANQFSSSRPHDWSLPQWMAYWAHGWAIETYVYRVRFMRLLTGMIKAVDNVLPENRSSVGQYLDSFNLRDARKILDSAIDVFNEAWDSELLNLVQQRMEVVEDLLEHRLRKRKYIVDAAQDVEFICGSGRIEKFICPVLYLLVRHHYAIIKLASQVVLDERELSNADLTLSTFTTEMYYRMYRLEAAFRQQRLDMQEEFKQFANGLFAYLWQEPEGLQFQPPMSDAPETTETPLLALMDKNRAEDEVLDPTVAILRFEPIAVPVGRAKDLLEGYSKSGLSSFNPDVRKYVELLRRGRLNRLNATQLNPELTDEEKEFAKEIENTFDDEARLFYPIIVHIEALKVPLHWNAICDNCGMVPIQGPRYVCFDCTVQFDICERCEPLSRDQVKYDTKVHPESHRLIRMEYPVTRLHRWALRDSAKQVMENEASEGIAASGDPRPNTLIPLSPLASLKLGKGLNTEDDKDKDGGTTVATLDTKIDGMERQLEKVATLDAKVEGIERRLERLENVLQAIAGKIGVEISNC